MFQIRRTRHASRAASECDTASAGSVSKDHLLVAALEDIVAGRPAEGPGIEGAGGLALGKLTDMRRRELRAGLESTVAFAADAAGTATNIGWITANDASACI